MLRVKLLAPGAKLPTVAHPGEDLGYDLFALEDTVLPFGAVVKVRTGIAAQYRPNFAQGKFGLLIEDRSSMADKGITKSAGVLDAGYAGEIKVMLTNHNPEHSHLYCGLHGYNINPDYPYDTETRGGYLIKAGDKIAQMVPTEVLTAGTIVEVDDLGQTLRGSAGFGSTGG